MERIEERSDRGVCLRMSLLGESEWIKSQSEREEGANKQQSRKKSDKDGIDSRTTGRVECDEEENDVRDKTE